MFESLGQIQRLTNNINQLEKQQKTLSEVYYRSIGDADKLQKQLDKSIVGVISKAKKQLDYCSNIEREVLNQSFIPSRFSVEKVVYDVKQLPDWFTFVFEKQYEKQKTSFAGMTKKLYTQHNLNQKKLQLERQIDSFSNLNQRYQGLNKTDRGCINIDLEAQTFQNKVALIMTKFVNFIELIGKKLIYFVEQNVQRSLNYSTNIKGFAENSNNFMRKQNFNQQPQAYLQRQSLREAKSIEKDNYRSTTSPALVDINRGRMGFDYPEHRPMTRASSSNRCMNHAHHHHDHYQRRPIITAFDESSSRFNYRDHAPKWMANTLSSFYY